MKLVKATAKALASGSQEADGLLAKSILTKVGARKWPLTAQKAQTNKHNTVLIDALRKTIAQLGNCKSSQLRGPVVGRLLSNCTSSISAAYVQAQLGIKDFARRKAMSLHKNNKARGGAILDSAYDTTNRQGGCRLDKMVQDIIVAFFFEHTHIDSAGGRSQKKK